VLAESCTVVAADLRGYGDSSVPPTAADHAPYSKRAMAADQVALMASLGFDRFAVVGHDRGGRVAYRMALDSPERNYFAGDTSIFDPEVLADYRRCVADPQTVHAMCEDYRAGAEIDDELDEADRAAGRRIACPVLVLWSGREELPRWFDVVRVWRGWADDVRGQQIDAGHYLAEAAPGEVAAAVATFPGEGA